MKRLFSLLLLFAVLTNLSFSMESAKSILKSKPYFTLLVDAKDSILIVRLNGITIMEHYDDSQVNVTFPVNHWMTSNDNEIELTIISKEKDHFSSNNSYAEIALQVQDESNLNESAIKLANIIFDYALHEVDPNGNAVSPSMGVTSLDSMNEFRVSQSGDVRLQKISFEKHDDKRHFYRIKRKVIIPSNLPRWAFFDSDPIPDISEQAMSDAAFDKFRDNLFAEYLKVFNAIKNKKIDSIMPMYEERFQEYDAAMYYSSGTMEGKVKDVLERAANDPDAELLDLKAEYLSFDIFKNNKLVRLVRADESKAIVQNFKKAKGSQSFDLIFRYKNGKWILTR